MAPSPRPLPLEPRDRLLALALVLAGFVSRLPFLGRDEGWFDEHYSIITATQSVSEIVRGALLEQTNPPGYYLLAHFWGQLGDASIEWHRLIPAVCGALVPAVTALAIRRLGFSRAAAAVAGLLLVVAPVPWNLSLEVRGYATLALLAASSLYVAAGIIASTEPPPRRSLMLLAALNVAQVLLHYFGAFAVLGVSIAVAEHERIRVGGTAREQARTWFRVATPLGAPAALTIAAWLGVSFAVFRGVGAQNVEWIPQTSSLSALLAFSNVLLGNLDATWGTWMSRLLLLAGVALAVLAAMRGNNSTGSSARARTTLLLTLLPSAAALLINAASGNDLWVQRYVAVLTPALALLVATVVEATAPRWRTVAAFGIAAWWGIAGVDRFANRVPKPEWSELITAMAPNGKATICANRSFVGLPFLYHASVARREGIVVVNAPRCQPGHGVTWLVYDVEPSGVKPAPEVPGLVLGPRIVLSRGLQNLDARRVIAREPATSR